MEPDKLVFADDRQEAVYQVEVSKASRNVTLRLRVACGILWTVAVARNCHMLLQETSSRSDAARYGLMTAAQAGMVAANAAWVAGLRRRWNPLLAEQAKCWVALAEMVACMFSAMLCPTGGAPRRPLAVLLQPAVVLPTVLIVIPQVRLQAALVLHALNLLCFLFTAASARLPAWGRPAPAAVTPLALEVAVYTCLGLLAPLAVSVILEARKRREFLRRYELPDRDLGPFWLPVSDLLAQLGLAAPLDSGRRQAVGQRSAQGR